MRAVLQHLWYEAVSSFWFLPLMMVIGAVGLYFLSSFLDRTFHPDIGFAGWLITRTGLETARTALSSIAAAMVTIAGLVVPITIVALQLASQEYSSRLIRAFMRDRVIQISLGIFFATFTFSLLLLTELPPEEETAVPRLSILIAILLSLASVIVLIFFIHRIARNIQPYNIVINVVDDLRKTSERFFSPPRDKDLTRRSGLASQGDIPPSFEQEGGWITARRAGYIEEINYRELALLADRFGLLIRLERRPGEFLITGDTLALAWPGGRLSVRILERIERLLIMGSERTLEMDIEFPIEQLLEVATRSLTEDVNDVFTARTCLNWLEDSFVHILQDSRRMANYYYRGDRLRLIIKPFRPAELMDEALQVFWNSARNNKALTAIMSVYLLKIIARLAGYAVTEDDRQVLRKHAEVIYSAAYGDDSLEDYERQRVREQYQKVIRAFSSMPA